MLEPLWGLKVPAGHAYDRRATPDDSEMRMWSGRGAPTSLTIDVAAPLLSQYPPAEHSMHSVAPLVAVYEPGRQGRH